jgi:2-dehydropantoate 2-reductase
MHPPRSIAIIAAGAVGGYYGGRLALQGQDVHFLVRSDFQAWRGSGLRVHSIAGDFHLPPKALQVYNATAAMPKVDLVLVTLKTTENHHLPSLLPPLLRDDTTILTMQNGLGNEEFLADHFGRERVMGAIAFTCINRGAPGVIHHLDHGFIRVGELNSHVNTGRLEAIVAMFNDAGVPASAVENLRAARWDKLVWNVPFNGLGAIDDQTTDQLIATRAGEARVRAVMNEVIAAATADGCELPVDVAERKLELTRSMGPYRTSTHVDRCAGRSMEIEGMFGEPLRIARKHDLPTRMLQMIHTRLSELNVR